MWIYNISFLELHVSLKPTKYLFTIKYASSIVSFMEWVLCNLEHFLKKMIILAEFTLLRGKFRKIIFFLWYEYIYPKKYQKKMPTKG